MNVATAIAGMLAEQGTRSIFGVPASETMATVVAAANLGLATYHARHEQAAVGMADGYARFSGQPGVVVVGRGPGFTNGLNALLTAAKARTPLVVLAGELPATARSPGAGRHVLHMKNVDQAGIARLAGCDTLIVEDPSTARATVGAAFARARQGHAVVLRLPTDVSRADALPQAPCAAEPPAAPDAREQAPGAPAPGAIEAVADLLQEQWACRRPLILAGRGAVAASARNQLLALGDRIGAVLTTSLPAKGLFTGHDADAGILGTLATPTCAELATRSDLILAFGVSLNPFTTYGGDLVSGARVVQFDTDPGSIGRHATVDLAVIGDAADSARLLAEELRRRGHQAGGYRTPRVLGELRRARAAAPLEVASGASRLDPAAALSALDTALPANRILVIDAGAHMPVAASSLSVPDPKSFVTTAIDYTSVGSAYGVALGAAIARPEVTTVLVIGDGGLAMALPDLQTAARYRLRLVVVVCNDAAFGQELQLLQLAGLPDEIARYPELSFSALARDFGLDGITFSLTDDLESVVSAIRERRLPLVVDCKVETGVAGEHSALVNRLGR